MPQALLNQAATIEIGRLPVDGLQRQKRRAANAKTVLSEPLKASDGTAQIVLLSLMTPCGSDSGLSHANPAPPAAVMLLVMPRPLMRHSGHQQIQKQCQCVTAPMP